QRVKLLCRHCRKTMKSSTTFVISTWPTDTAAISSISHVIVARNITRPSSSVSERSPLPSDAGAHTEVQEYESDPYPSIVTGCRTKGSRGRPAQGAAQAQRLHAEGPLEGLRRAFVHAFQDRARSGGPQLRQVRGGRPRAGCGHG